MLVAPKTKVLVVGLGKSGLAAAHLLRELGADLTVTDSQGASVLGDKPAWLKAVNFIPQHSLQDQIDSFQLVVVSPGVPLTLPFLTKAKKLGIPIWSELELGFRYLKGKVVAVTGTNGKTTTTHLLGQLFRDAGYPVIVAGNVGVPLSTLLRNVSVGGVTVLEASSFQLEAVDRFHCWIAVITNITPDHLDRHGSLQEYVRCKANILRNQSESDYAVLNYDDAIVRELRDRTQGTVIYFSRQTIPPAPSVYIEQGWAQVNFGGESYSVVSTSSFSLRGSHNVENCLAAIAVGVAAGIDPAIIAHTLATFPGVAHRLETVDNLGGIEFINDSKGTNPDAAIKALQSFERPIIWIGGGRNKGSSFELLAKEVQKRARYAIVLGESAHEIIEALDAVGYRQYISVSGLEEAVYQAYQLAQPGDVVLLSPACASWDMFRSYEERGDKFKELVSNLREGKQCRKKEGAISTSASY
ncbi:MAG: UDP-N-acetylmuramoyl-L-alanine--D-glutamate ligase [Clostridia bacterium]|nr:UDP-N-acetylmuramoyl-L-alanine--D-glutamate ligase [Clostridia bacterium]